MRRCQPCVRAATAFDRVVGRATTRDGVVPFPRYRAMCKSFGRRRLPDVPADAISRCIRQAPQRVGLTTRSIPVMIVPIVIRRRLVAPAAILVLALGACGRDLATKVAADAASSDLAEFTPAPAVQGEAVMARRARVEANAADAAATDALQRPTTGDTALLPSMIIRTGNASVVVDSLEVAVAQVRALAQRLGGFVANTAMQTGPEHLRSASLTLRIPSNRYDEALGGLQPIGRVETVHSEAQDVGEEFVDVQARVANARRLEERLVGLLATRTGRLDDVLAVERELARVREQIERFEGRLRYLRARVALSTLTVTVHEPAPLLGSNPSASVIGDAFVAGWRNFLAFVAGLIAAMGWLVPAGIIAALVALAVRRLGANVRPWRRGGSTEEAPPATP